MEVKPGEDTELAVSVGRLPGFQGRTKGECSDFGSSTG